MHAERCCRLNLLETLLQEIESHIVPKQSQPVRLSDHVAGIFATISSKKGMKKAIAKGLVKVDGELGKTGKFLSGGETIVLYRDDKQEEKPVLKLEIEIVFEDEYLAVIHKPAGIVVSGNQFRTIENALPHNLTKSTLVDALERPQAIHRLDFPTSGLLLIGKNRKTVVALNQLFENKEIEKAYHAISLGEMKRKSGLIDHPINNKTAQTRFEVLQSQESPKFGYLNLLRLDLLTGRRHQIRIHLLAEGHPILGDRDYQLPGQEKGGKGLYLHASELRFMHPVSGEQIDLSLDLPKKFRRIFS